ncbi:helix-turn-helix domain-containing protein [Streptomyces sp. NPDC056501]|uniref:helix-turn-helix domain-containing protein n=1 Tax=Streptomyces sp. NPDC056501 TaxID=3345841 RepID=UPI0036D16D9C
MRRHTCSRGDCELVLVRPDARLRPGVIGYGAYRLAGGEPQQWYFAPNGSVSVFLTLDGEMSAGHTGQGEGAATTLSRPSVFYGAHARPKILRRQGAVEGVEISVLPWVARRLFGASMDDLADTVVDADAVIGRHLPFLAEAVSEASDWPARFAVLDRQLLRWTARADNARSSAREPAPTVLRAWDLITGTAGTMPIHDVATRARWSRRQLEIRFREQIGLTPKRLARGLRLDRAITLLSTGLSQADTASAAGFSDQPHLAREFRTLTGMPPGRFLHALTLGCSWPTMPQDPLACFAFVQDREGGPSPDFPREGRTAS